MKDLTPALRSLGLADSEIKTYLAAFEEGASTVIDLAKKTRLSRQATYSAIEDLTKRGLMSHVVHGKKKLYSAEHPRKLVTYARQRATQMQEQISDLENSIPELELQMGGERPVVKVYEGKEGIQAIIEEMRKSVRGEYLEMTDLDSMYKVLSPEDLKPLREAVSKMETNSKCIYIGTPITQRPAADRYFLPKEIGGFKSNITIFSDKVIIVTFEGKMTSLIIESATAARAFRTMFLLALESAKKYPKK